MSMTKLALAVSLAGLVAGCLHDDLVACSDNELCPIGTLCDSVHGGCISVAQSTACVGALDHTACTADGVPGYCLDQICIEPSCGNRVVDDGEICDDGNHV